MESVAIKISSLKVDPRRLKIEQMILIMLRGRRHIPTMIGCGTNRGNPYIVMQILGKNLSELRKRVPGQKLSSVSVFRVSSQIVLAIGYLHEIGFLHRDIKPANFCIGRGKFDRRTIYLVDFGMARMFTLYDGSYRRARKNVGFRGI
ncbi:hypothetical protein AB6A40_011385 [Gnathostoma spinigerum]|uniref:non-specific serine/threonine protein kinase n=1 Tax=Gnathostoma spinigerum TaxID=75299 RepID=A0ABD6EZ60_9BILA